MAEKKTVKTDNTISAELRERFGKGAARKLRAIGKIPAVIYGHGTEPQHVSLPGHEVALIIRKANAILNLDISGTKQLALVKDVQKDPVRQVIEHLDLIIVRKGEKVHVEVPVHVEGEPFPGTIAMLEAATLRLEVEATHIPEHIIISVEDAEDGTQIHAKDITLPAGAILIDDPDLLVVNIVTPVGSSEDIGTQDEAESAADAEESSE